MDMTATEAFEKLEAERGNDRLNRSIAAFIERYGPTDRQEAGWFNAHLHDIVRAVYADMSKPVERALSSTLVVASRHIHIPLRTPDEENK